MLISSYGIGSLIKSGENENIPAQPLIEWEFKVLGHGPSWEIFVRIRGKPFVWWTRMKYGKASYLAEIVLAADGILFEAGAVNRGDDDPHDEEHRHARDRYPNDSGHRIPCESISSGDNC